MPPAAAEEWGFNMFDQIIYGMEFYRHPGPDLEELKRNMDILKAKGFNLLRIQEVWSYEEPKEGIYDFEKIKGLVLYAEKICMDLIITFTLECAPPWLYKFNDVFQRNAYYEPIIETTPYPLPADGKPGPCWDNPIAIKAAENFLKAFIGEVGESDSIKGWAVWQEAGIWTWNDSKGKGGSTYCYCTHTLEQFRTWLQNKYKTLDSLNFKLMTNFGDWSYISPPNGYNGSYMVPLASEFFHFMVDRMGMIAKWKKDIVNRYDSKKRPVMCHINGGTLHSGIGNKWDDEYVLAKHMDSFGMSLYPKWGYGNTPDKAVNYVMLASDGCRCASKGKDVWVAEMQGGRQASGLRRSAPPTGNDIRNWTFATLGRGIKGIVYWQYREDILLQEACGHGVLNRRGESMPWLGEFSEMLDFLKRNDICIKSGAIPESKIAIAVNMDSHILGFQCDSEELVVGSTRNIYNWLIERNIFPDFLWKEQMTEENLERYKVVFFPTALAMSKEYAEVISRYVRNGGIVVSDACPGAYDEVSNATSQNPPFGLDKVFGCIEQDYYDMDDPFLKGTDEVVKILNGVGEFDGLGIKLHLLTQTYHLCGGKGIFSLNGSTAGVMNAYGNGRTYLIGTMFMYNESNSVILDRLLVHMGIDLPSNKTIMEMSLNSEHGKVIFYYNREKEAVSIEIGEKEDRIIKDFYGCVVKTEKHKQKVCLNGNSSCCIIFT